MDDLVRRKELLDIMANCTSSWGQGLDKELRRDWALGVKIKDNFLREIEKLEAVPEASVDKLTELLVANGMHVNARSLAKYILDNCALFATNHLPLELKQRSDCPSSDYCKGWNDAVKQMAASHMQATPCKVGDKLWFNSGAFGPFELEVQEIHFRKEGCVISLEGGSLCADITSEDIGKTAFFSENEALAALDDNLKVVDEVLGEAASKCEEVNRGRQQTKSGRTLDGDSLVWGGVDAAGRVEEDYDLY